MAKAGDSFVRFCSSLNDIPAAVLCVAMFLLQTAVMDYYLIANISLNHWSWIGPDLINLTLLIISIVGSYSALHSNSGRGREFYSLAWVSWLLMSIFVSVKTIVVFSTFGSKLTEEDPSFFGPNTLKTAIALGSCVFFLLLITQHNAPLGSERKRYIEELTGTVVFDILDTVDILEILFKPIEVLGLWSGLREFILAVASLNLIIPTIPLLTLCKTKFGHDKLAKWLVYVHRLSVVMVVNVPNLLVRLILWNVFSGAISPFSLKNIIIIAMTMYEFYQHKKETLEEREHEQENIDMNGKNDTHLNSHSNSRHKRETSEEDDTCKNNGRRGSNFSFSIEQRVVTDI